MLAGAIILAAQTSDSIIQIQKSGGEFMLKEYIQYHPENPPANGGELNIWDSFENLAETQENNQTYYLVTARQLEGGGQQVINISYYDEHGTLTPFTSYIPFRNLQNLPLPDARYADMVTEQVAYMNYSYNGDRIVKKELKDMNNVTQIEYRYIYADDPPSRLITFEKWGKTKFGNKFEKKNYVTYHYPEGDTNPDTAPLGYSYFNQEEREVFRLDFAFTSQDATGTDISGQRYVKYRSDIATSEAEEVRIEYYIVYAVNGEGIIEREIQYSGRGYIQSQKDYTQMEDA